MWLMNYYPLDNYEYVLKFILPGYRHSSSKPCHCTPPSGSFRRSSEGSHSIYCHIYLLQLECRLSTHLVWKYKFFTNKSIFMQNIIYLYGIHKKLNNLTAALFKKWQAFCALQAKSLLRGKYTVYLYPVLFQLNTASTRFFFMAAKIQLQRWSYITETSSEKIVCSKNIKKLK